MSTVGQFSGKTPTVKRILREAAELANSPSPDYTASPLESNLFEWHFTLRGPPAPSPFAGGIYHGRIVLPPTYPLRPPSFRFLTPSGRFEANREICLSISGHHEESWQPAWGIRTAIVAIRSFMDSEAGGQLGGMNAAEGVRKRLAAESKAWRCTGCGKSCEEVMREQEERVKEAESEGRRKEEAVPQELKLGYRDELGKEGEAGSRKADEATADLSAGSSTQQQQQREPVDSSTVKTPVQASIPATAGPAMQPPTTSAPVQRQLQQQPLQQRPAAQADVPTWIDKAIIGVVVALAYILLRKFL